MEAAAVNLAHSRNFESTSALDFSRHYGIISGISARVLRTESILLPPLLSLTLLALRYKKGIFWPRDKLQLAPSFLLPAISEEQRQEKVKIRYNISAPHPTPDLPLKSQVLVFSPN